VTTFIVFFLTKVIPWL